MTIPFTAFFSRVSEKTGITSQMELASVLGVNRSAVTQAKNRDAVPPKWILALSRRYGLSPDWLESGNGATHALPTPQVLPAPESLTVMVPKVRATLCAGGGSLELEAVTVSEHPLPRTWLSRMGRTEAMVFMDVIGNSMEPGIRDGDMVLVDQSCDQIVPRSVMAVGYDEAIYLKRLEKSAGGLTLHSDNPDFGPMTIAGDELASFRVIGKVVWMCRDCRYL